MASELTVSDIMTREVIALLEEQNLAQVLATFERFTFHHLPVVDDRKIVGMLSHRDVLRATAAYSDHSPLAQAREERFLSRTFVRDLMKTTVRTIGPEATVREAATHMLEAHVDALAVVDGTGDMIGIVTAHDVLRMVRDGR